MLTATSLEISHFLLPLFMILTVVYVSNARMNYIEREKFKAMCMVDDWKMLSHYSQLVVKNPSKQARITGLPQGMPTGLGMPPGLTLDSGAIHFPHRREHACRYCGVHHGQGYTGSHCQSCGGPIKR